MVPLGPLSTLIPWKWALHIVFGHHPRSLLKSIFYITVSVAIVISWECVLQDGLFGPCPLPLLKSGLYIAPSLTSVHSHSWECSLYWSLCSLPITHYPFSLLGMSPHYPGVNAIYFSIVFSVCHVRTLSTDTKELGNWGKVRMRSL